MCGECFDTGAKIHACTLLFCNIWLDTIWMHADRYTLGKVLQPIYMNILSKFLILSRPVCCGHAEQEVQAMQRGAERFVLNLMHLSQARARAAFFCASV